MPTATAFKHPGYFPGCIQSKTTSQLDSIAIARVEVSTLSDAMAYYWNTYTVTLAAAIGALSTTRTSLVFVKGTAGDTISALRGYSEATPRDRVCANWESSNSGMGGVACPNPSGESIDIGFCMNSVYYNTTTSKYALMVTLEIKDPSGDYVGFSYDPGAGHVSNGGTFTIFGSTVPSWKKTLSSDITASVSSPAYYTY